MIVRIRQSLWNAGEMDALAVSSFCRAADAECHVLLTSPPWDETDLSQPVSQWLIRHGWRSDPPSEQSAYIVELLRAGLERLMDADRAGVPVVSVEPGPSDWSAGRLSWSDALALLERPLVLLVEGKDNDGAFVRRMAAPHQRGPLEAMLRERRARFEGASGIDGIIRALTDAKSPDSPEAWLRRLRLWVLFDRDADEQDRRRAGPKSREAATLLEEIADDAADAWPVPGQRLARRAIENYVPLSTLEGWWPAYHRTGSVAEGKQREREATVEAFARLPPEMRRLFNMKKGLVGDATLSEERWAAVKKRGAPLTEAELSSLPEGWRRALFDELDEGERAALRNGFPVVTDAWRDPDAISPTWPTEPGIPADEQQALLEEGSAIVESILRSV